MSTTLKFALLVLGAAVLALTARVLFANMAAAKNPVDTSVHVRVAANDLPTGLLLREEDLDWKPYDKSKVPEGALIKHSAAANNMAGVLIRKTIGAGAIITNRDIVRPDAPGFLAAVLKPGARAVSVPVDNVSGNAGLIQPGDYVDMILVQAARNRDDLDSERARSVVSETVVENVRVIAVGSVFQHQSEGIEVRKNAQAARTVTIEVTPRAAEAVTVASKLGTLSMALRSFAVADRSATRAEDTESVVAWDNSAIKSAPVWAGDVSRAIGWNEEPPATREESRPFQTREVTIMRGSKRDRHTLGNPATEH